MAMPESLRAPARQVGRKEGAPRVGREQGLGPSAGGGALRWREPGRGGRGLRSRLRWPRSLKPRGRGGLQAAKKAAAEYRQAFPDLRVSVEDLVAEGDRVAARLRFRGTHLGELDGIAPTGRRVDCSGIVISRIEEGKIAEDWANFDDLGMMRQLGLIPEPGQRHPSTS